MAPAPEGDVAHTPTEALVLWRSRFGGPRREHPRYPAKGVARTKNRVHALYLVVWIAVIVSVDFLFLRHRTTERLIVNIGMVLGFAVAYWGRLKKR